MHVVEQEEPIHVVVTYNNVEDVDEDVEVVSSTCVAAGGEDVVERARRGERERRVPTPGREAAHVQQRAEEEENAGSMEE